MGQVQPELSEGRTDQCPGGIGDHEDHVARLGREAFEHAAAFRVAEELHDV
jgi:hypothetical protein